MYHPCAKLVIKLIVLQAYNLLYNLRTLSHRRQKMRMIVSTVRVQPKSNADNTYYHGHGAMGDGHGSHASSTRCKSAPSGGEEFVSRFIDLSAQLWTGNSGNEYILPVYDLSDKMQF